MGGTDLSVLFLEDDEETADAIERGLARAGIGVSVARDAPSALDAIARRRFDAAILDVMVPGGSGLEVLENLRREGLSTPVLMLTARDSIEDRVAGLEGGADDYLVKPFAFAELLARLRALLRRPEKRIDSLQLGELEIDLLHRRVSFEERRIDLSRTEFDLLYCLASRRGEILGRQILLEEVWGYRFDPGTNVVDVHVNRLRRKLEANSVGDLVRTVRGVGYVVD